MVKKAHKKLKAEPFLSRYGYHFMMLFRPLVKYLWVGKVYGLEHIPEEGPYIVASNHESYFDFILFAAVSKRKIHYLAAEKFYVHPLWKWVMYFMGCIRVDRHSTVNVQAYKEIKRVVQQGRLVGIFPEGTRSPDGKLRRGKKGVAHLVISAGLPVIPVGMRGTFEIMSIHDRWPRLKRADIYIGTPILFENVESEHIDDNMLQIITDHIMHQIAALSGVNYIHSEDYVRKNYVI